MFPVGAPPFPAARRLIFPAYRPMLRSDSISRLRRRSLSYSPSSRFSDPPSCRSSFRWIPSSRSPPAPFNFPEYQFSDSVSPPTFFHAPDSIPPPTFLSSRFECQVPDSFLDGIVLVLLISGVVSVILSLLLFLSI